MPRTIGILSPESNGPFIVIGSPMGSVGTQVEKNQVIMVLNGDKVAYEITAPEHGAISAKTSECCFLMKAKCI